MQNIADQVLLPGYITEGGEISLDLAAQEASCATATIYADGLMHTVKAATVEIDKPGVIFVGVYLLKSVITELEDGNLYSNAIGCLDEGEPGAFRGKVEAVWGVEGDHDAPFHMIYTIENGQITRSNISGVASKHTHTLEQIVGKLGKEGQVLGMHRGRPEWLDISGGNLVVIDDEGGPNLSALIHNVPDYILTGESAAVSFRGLVNPNAPADPSAVCIDLFPLDSGLIFAQTRDINQGDEIEVTAPLITDTKRVRFRMIAYNVDDYKSTSRTFDIDILVIIPDFSDLLVRVPLEVVSGKADYVQVSKLNNNADAATKISIDPMASGLTFTQTSNIALGTKVNFTAPALLAEKIVKIKVTATNSKGIANSKEFDIKISVSAPDITGLNAPLPANLTATLKYTATFTGATDPQGWPVTFTVDPMSSGLTFAKTSGLALGESTQSTVPDSTVNKAVSYKVTAANKAGKTVSKVFNSTILGVTAPSLATFAHNVPAAIQRQTSVNVSFWGAAGSNGHVVTYRIDVGTSGLIFNKLNGITANEWVSMTSPSTTQAVTTVTFKVYAVDTVTGKEGAYTLPLDIKGIIVAPSISAPIESAQQIALQPVIQLSTFSVSGGIDTAAGLRVQVSTDKTFTQVTYDSNWIAYATTHTVAQKLALGTQYYLRAAYKGTALGVGPWSGVRSFKTTAFVPMFGDFSIPGGGPFLRDSIMTSDGYIVAVGSHYSPVIKLKADLSVVNQIQLSDNNPAIGIAPALNGGCVVFGANAQKAQLFKLNSDLTIEKQKSLSYLGSYNTVGNSIITTTDGRYIIRCYDISKNHFIVKLNSDLTINKEVKIPSPAYIQDIIPTADGGFAMIGAYDAGVAKPDCALIKFKSDMTIERQIKFNATAFGGVLCLTQTVDGGYAVCGYTNDVGDQARGLVLKFKYDLTLDKFVLLDNDYFSCRYMLATNDGGFLIVGLGEDSTGNTRYIVKFKSDSTIERQLIISNRSEIYQSLIPIENGFMYTGGCIFKFTESTLVPTIIPCLPNILLKSGKMSTSNASLSTLVPGSLTTSNSTTVVTDTNLVFKPYNVTSTSCEL